MGLNPLGRAALTSCALKLYKKAYREGRSRGVQQRRDTRQSTRSYERDSPSKLRRDSSSGPPHAQRPRGSAMMKATSRPEMVQIAVSAVKMEGRKSGGDKDKDAKKEDAQQLCEAIMEEIVDDYEGGTANSGNKDNHNTSFYENLPASEKEFGELVESRARFISGPWGPPSEYGPSHVACFAPPALCLDSNRQVANPLRLSLKNPNWGKKHGRTQGDDVPAPRPSHLRRPCHRERVQGGDGNTGKGTGQGYEQAQPRGGPIRQVIRGTVTTTGGLCMELSVPRL
ncbi:hypothetical protein THAOC_05071 [Thalassiosira oceanica]|uniref:Uncharacterized protein n=1 Tax=Thalassiosira oceanica TaxID=159749 RepID=K0TN96_THAOC|nr:hypothetical protein THAOC_05071 [Thalassiosira oceanica]|eukprot:EJK73312.1 hypothetical protein THAOC_05071 [Thalassiosira oceanica]